MRPRNVKWSTASDPATQNTIWVSIKRNSHSFHWLLDFNIINVLIGGAVKARGCSTLQPNFNKCDTNKYGQFKSDKYCYCKKSYCNTASSCLPNLYCLGRTTTLWFNMTVSCCRCSLLHVPPPLVCADPGPGVRRPQMTGACHDNSQVKSSVNLDQWLTLPRSAHVVLFWIVWIDLSSK